MTAVLEAPVAALLPAEPTGVCLICRNPFPLSALAGGECLACTCVDERTWARRTDR